MLWKLKPIWALIGATLFGMPPDACRVRGMGNRKKGCIIWCIFSSSNLAIHALASKNDRKLWRYILILVLFLFSLLSKIQAVALPLALLCIDYWMERPINFKLILEKVPHFLLAFGTGVLGVVMLTNQGSIEGSSDIFGFVDRIFIASFSLVNYIYKFFIPNPLSPLYPYPANLEWFHYVSAVLPFLLLGVLIFTFKKARPIFFGLLFFLVNVVFVLQLVGAGQAYLADRFTYIAYLGLFFMVCWYLQKITGDNIQYQSVAIGGMTIIIAIFTFISFNQTKIWKNGETMWSHVLKYHEDTPLPWGIVDFIIELKMSF